MTIRQLENLLNNSKLMSHDKDKTQVYMSLFGKDKSIKIKSDSDFTKPLEGVWIGKNKVILYPTSE